jgi:isocitrate dehydrogenase
MYCSIYLTVNKKSNTYQSMIKRMTILNHPLMGFTEFGRQISAILIVAKYILAPHFIMQMTKRTKKYSIAIINNLNHCGN